MRGVRCSYCELMGHGDWWWWGAWCSHNKVHLLHTELWVGCTLLSLDGVQWSEHITECEYDLTMDPWWSANAVQCSLLWAGPVNHVSCVLTEIRMFAVASSSGSVIVTRDHDTNVEVDTCYMWWRDVDWHRHNNLVVLTWGKTWDDERWEHHLANTQYRCHEEKCYYQMKSWQLDGIGGLSKCI